MSREQAEKLFDGITEIRDDLIEAALDAPLKSRRPRWKTWGAIAACAVVAIGFGGALRLLPFGGNAASGGGGHGEGSVFMSYAGPIFPLTLENAEAGVSAARNLTYDFGLTSEEAVRVWGGAVEDGYTLHNASPEEKTVTALYPFAGCFWDLQERLPTLTVEGQTVSPTLRVGSDSGDRSDSSGGDNAEGGGKRVHLGGWEDYQALLADGRYQTAAFSPPPTLAQTVTVYTFTEFQAPLEDYEAATQAISFTIDPAKTTIFHYGFEGGELGENGFRRYSYFVPEESSGRWAQTKQIIVLGEDLGDYAMEGYKNGACEPGNGLDGVRARVTRSNEGLSEVMERLSAEFLQQYQGKPPVSPELFFGAASAFMNQTLSAGAREEPLFGHLESLFSEVGNLQRVFYLEVPITLPGGGDVSVTATLRQKPSFDYACSGSEQLGIQGYDMVTSLGSNLPFDALTAALTSTERIEIVRQNYGFDLPQGVKRVTLDPAVERYYLEIRPVELPEKPAA